MKDKNQTIMEALTIIPTCALEISLRTELPYKEVMRRANRLAKQGKIVKPSSSTGETTYRKKTHD